MYLSEEVITIYNWTVIFLFLQKNQKYGENAHFYPKADYFFNLTFLNIKFKNKFLPLIVHFASGLSKS